jgi:hypothetical protein
VKLPAHRAGFEGHVPAMLQLAEFPLSLRLPPPLSVIIEYQIVSEYHRKIGRTGDSCLGRHFVGFDEILNRAPRGV